MSFLRRRVLLVAFIFIYACYATATTPPPKESTLVVAVPVADMHSAATEDSDIVSQAIYSATVVVLEQTERWAKVRTADQYTGWMPRDSTRAQSDGQAYASSGKIAVVDSLFANLYREPDVTQHQPVLVVPFETGLEIAEEPADKPLWLKVRLADGDFAWLQRGDTNPAPHPLSIPESIVLGRRFLGIPYLWGGRSSFGYDCSGFTQMLVRSRGITMPRDADLQAAWQGVVPVERKDLKAGDLLFFGAGPNNISHTGMYIGDGQFIHDTTNGHPVVQISQLDGEPWTRVLVACRRVK